MTQFKGFAGNSEAQLRQILGALFQQESPGLAKDGVIRGLGVTQTPTASASVVVGKGFGIVQDTALAGATPLVSNSDETLDVLTANPLGGLPRNDLIVFDSATVNPTTGLGGIRAIIGTQNASPTDPSIPASAIPLARLRHFSSATTIPTSRIDDLRVPTRLGAGMIGWGGYTNTDVPGGSGAASVDKVVTFPPGLFTAQPVVLVSWPAKAYIVNASGVALDGSQFTATASRVNGNNVTDAVSFQWLAFQFIGL